MDISFLEEELLKIRLKYKDLLIQMEILIASNFKGQKLLKVKKIYSKRMFIDLHGI